MIALWMVLGLVAAAFLLHILLGARGSRQTRAVHDFLLDEGRRRTRQSFTIMVTLDRRADSIMPLLDHLRMLSYPKLQVIIIFKHTAGPKAKTALTYYKNKHKLKTWRIVSHRRGMTITSAAQRYATGQYVLTLRPGSRVDDGLFDRLSRALVSTGASALVIRSLLRPVGTFAMAAVSLSGLIGTTVNQLSARPRLVESLTDGVVIRRNSLDSNLALTARPFLLDHLYIDDTAVVAPAPRLSVRAMAVLSGVSVVLIALFALGWMLLSNSELWLLAGLMAAACVAIVISLQVSNKGYRAIDMLNMALFLPIAPVYGLLRLIGHSLRAIISARRQRQASRP